MIIVQYFLNSFTTKNGANFPIEISKCHHGQVVLVLSIGTKSACPTDVQNQNLLILLVVRFGLVWFG